MMINGRLLARLSAGVALLALGASAWASSVERTDPGLDRLIAPNAELVSVYQQRDGFFEGPTWVPGKPGFLLFSDIPGNRLMEASARGKVTTFLADVRRSDTTKALHDSLYTNRDLIGSNGTALKNGHTLILAVFGAARLDSLDLRSRIQSKVASGRGEPAFTRPNDVAFGPNGDLYFSAEEGLFRLHDGAVTLFRTMKANGLAFSPDGKFLYASDGFANIVKIMLEPDGSAGKTTLFLDVRGDPAKDEFLDGMKVDAKGNLWAVGPGGIWVIAPDGTRLGRILAPTFDMPTGPHHRFTNLAFGGKDGRSLFLTAPGGVYRVLLRSSAWERGR